MVLEKLEPKEVFKYFEELSNIPRGSGNEKAASDYTVDFAKSHNLFVKQDDYNNVIIKKPGTKGYENAPAVILQGHLDMVCEKNMGTEHDFLKDGLKLLVDGDIIRADGTTLGADNGVAVALSLAILAANNINHPPLEVIFTTEEETGLTGATNLDMSILKAKYLINLDSEGEGKILASCAGGIRADLNIPYKKIDVLPGFSTFSLSIRGLVGGHSGIDIIKQRGNAAQLLARLLYRIETTFEMYLSRIDGGLQDNAIPREAKAVVNFSDKDLGVVNSFILDFEREIKAELLSVDDEVFVEFKEMPINENKAIDKESTNNIISTILSIPNGVNTMSVHIEGLVESSSNIGILTTKEDFVKVGTSIRSSTESLKYFILEKLEILSKLAGAEIETRGSYPSWEFEPVSNLREIVSKTYEELSGKKAEVMAFHAGVECGIFAGKMKELDMVSIGPNIESVHNPQEHLEISSMKRTYELLIKVLEKMKS